VADSLFNTKFALASVFGRSDETLKEALVTLGDARRVNDRDAHVYQFFRVLMALYEFRGDRKGAEPNLTINLLSNFRGWG